MAPLSSPASKPSRLLRILQPALLTAMVMVAIAHTGGILRLLPSLHQPFAGVVLTWRKEQKMYVVGVTPPHWSGIAAGLRVNDRVLCIAGHRLLSNNPGATEKLPEINSICPQSPQWFSTILREQAANGTSVLSFTIQRRGVIMTVTDVPVRYFTIKLLLDVYLLCVLSSLGFLVLGFIVFRAQSQTQTHLLFTLWTTVSSAFLVAGAYNILITEQWANMRTVFMLLAVPWIPLWGPILFLFVASIRQHPALTTLTRWIGPAYLLISALFAVLGVIAYVLSDQPIGRALDWPYLSFVAGSGIFAILWAIGWMTEGWLRGHDIRHRAQAGLLLIGLALIVVSIFLPYLLNFFTDLPLGKLYYVVYAGPAAIAVMAYAIVRYQLFPVRSRTLDLLVLTVFCTIVAGATHLLLDQEIGFVALFMACLATALGIQMGGRPLRFLTRILRPERYDFTALVDFSQQIGQLPSRNELRSVIQRAFFIHLDVETVQFCIFEDNANSLECTGDPPLKRSMSATIAAQIVKDPYPVHDSSPAAHLYRCIAPDGTENNVAVWVPLVEGGHAVGLLGIGPRWTGQGFSTNDLELITVLAHQLALALLNLQQLEKLMAASQLIRQAQETERLKIARELHDTILQFLHVLTYGLDEIGERTPSVATDIGVWQGRISQEAHGLRHLLTYLRAPELLVQQGLINALHAWLVQVQMQTPLEFCIDLDQGIEDHLNLDTRIAIYRVIREAVHNAVKYSNGQHVWVTAQQHEQTLSFSVRDDGRGFDMDNTLRTSAKGYSSLLDLQEYLATVGGTLTIESTAGRGTAVLGIVYRKLLVTVESTKDSRETH